MRAEGGDAAQGKAPMVSRLFCDRRTGLDQADGEGAGSASQSRRAFQVAV